MTKIRLEVRRCNRPDKLLGFFEVEATGGRAIERRMRRPLTTQVRYSPIAEPYKVLPPSERMQEHIDLEVVSINRVICRANGQRAVMCYDAIKADGIPMRALRRAVGFIPADARDVRRDSDQETISLDPGLVPA